MRRLMPLIVLVLVSCTTASSTMLGTAKRRLPVGPDRVAIYRTAEQVPSKYEEVALITTTQQWGYTYDEKRTYDRMKIEAGQLGANAVILDSITEPSAGAKLAAVLLGSPAERKGKAVAIYIFPNEQKSPAETP